MASTKNADITDLLRRFRRGDRDAETFLFRQVYDELRRIARRSLAAERPWHSLQASALVNETYLRLIDQRGQSWQNRAHFFAFAARLMRQILIDDARRYRAAKRGNGKPPLPIDNPSLPVAGREPLDRETLIALDEALTRLGKINPRQSRIVELRFFAGMSSQEIAEALRIGERTVDRDWAAAQIWLHAQMQPLT